MARLIAKCGAIFLVDAGFKKKHRNKTWYILNTGYPAWGGITVHRMVIGDVPEGMVVDHINGNKLDNRKKNLRIITQSQNVMRSEHKINRYRGVGWSKQKQLWRARLVKDYHDLHLGFYKTSEEAAKAYDAKALELFGEFANLNFKEPK